MAADTPNLTYHIQMQVEGMRFQTKQILKYIPDQTNFKIQSQGYNKQKHAVPSWDVHRE
jgi:hypothetical protein